MFLLRKPSCGEEVILQSIDWQENFPWRQETGVRTEKDKYEVCLQLKDFGPDEITVKTADRHIVVEAQHDEKKDDYGYVTRHFKRKYLLPEDTILEKVVSKFSSEGILTITAPRKLIVKKDTVIPVSHESKVKSKL